MIIQKEEFIKKRRTRIEIVEERILNAEKILEQVKEEFREEDEKELYKLHNILSDLREMKLNILKIEAEEKLNLDKKVNELKGNSLLILNNAKVEIMNENEKMKSIKTDDEDYIRKLEKELMLKNLELELVKTQEDKLLEVNSSLGDEIRILKSKAYGYDIAKKYEYYINKVNNEKTYINSIDPNRNKTIENDKLAISLWEKQFAKNLKNPTKLDDISKHNLLWIGNSSSNAQKLIYDIESLSKK